MEAQNNVNAVDNSLQRESSTSLLIGYVVVLAAMFVAFEWTQRDVTINMVDDTPVYDSYPVDDMIPVTRQEQPVQAPPPAAAPQTPEILDVVENDVELPQEEMSTSEEVN
ncbi:MAG: energy transducer TonB, partial [Bacteroidaceae bacterium]|nr:energy transducer TonB [Bacteroidaceae bacterium]